MAECTGCHYRRRISSSFNTKACHYAIDTDKLRGCSAQECFDKKIHYMPRKRKRTNRGKKAVIIPSVQNK